MIALLRGSRGRRRAQSAGVPGHVHFETAEFGRQTLIHVEVIVGLSLLFKDLVEHWGTLSGRKAVGNGGGLPPQDHLSW